MLATVAPSLDTGRIVARNRKPSPPCWRHRSGQRRGRCSIPRHFFWCLGQRQQQTLQDINRPLSPVVTLPVQPCRLGMGRAGAPACKPRCRQVVTTVLPPVPVTPTSVVSIQPEEALGAGWMSSARHLSILCAREEDGEDRVRQQGCESDNPNARVRQHESDNTDARVRQRKRASQTTDTPESDNRNVRIWQQRTTKEMDSHEPNANNQKKEQGINKACGTAVGTLVTCDPIIRSLATSCDSIHLGIWRSLPTLLSGHSRPY